MSNYCAAHDEEGYCPYCEVQNLKIENTRYREALELIAKKCEFCDYGYDEFPCTCFDRPFVDEIARAALE